MLLVLLLRCHATRVLLVRPNSFFLPPSPQNSENAFDQLSGVDVFSMSSDISCCIPKIARNEGLHASTTREGCPPPLLRSFLPPSLEAARHLLPQNNA